MASKAASKRALTPKEASLFKELLTLYETKQLKKGVKTADQILKKFPDHGETLCMKGLILAHMGQRDEGKELVKKGMRLDLTSHIVWHVFGLIQKGEKNYEEALKSYTQALRFDKDNMNILRDAAHLQTQLRLYDGLVETRHTLLKLRPTLRQHWTGLAVAHYLNGNLEQAKNVLEKYESILKNVPDYDVEHSETLLYHVRILEELGEYSEALNLLDTNAKERAIVDKTAIMEFRARLLSKLELSEAEHAWRVLIDHNSENHEYYKGYLSCKGLSLDEKSLEALKDLSSQLPKASVPRRLALTLASEDDFKNLARPYITSGLTKGIPSLFVDIKSLYSDQSKLQAIQDIVEDIRKEAETQSQTSDKSADPSMYVWTLYFLAQHYSFLSQHSHALEIIELAISHTPTLPELYMFKARILKRAGDLLGASRSMEDARLLDGQDRFLNTKSAKYRLRAGLVDEASTLLGMFTKKDAPSPGADLEDMQSLLYLLEEADAHRRNGKPNLALKKYLAVQKIFNEIEDDQYDFHGYCLRKFNINIYLNLLSWEDNLRSQPAYIKTAIRASEIFVAVHDDPKIATAASSGSQLTDAEKKAKKKAKKAAQKVQEEVKKPTATSSNEDKGLEPPTPKDDDPDGFKVLACSDPLEQAAKLLQPLTKLAKNNIEAWIAVYDVAIRRKKLLQAIQALNHARALDAENPELHLRIIHARKTASSIQPPSSVGSVFTEQLNEILTSEVSLDTYNSQFLQKHSTSPGAILACAKASQELGATREEVENTVFGILGEEVKLDVETAIASLSFLDSLKSPRKDELRASLDKKFELSTLFKPATELAALKESVLAPPASRETDGQVDTVI
ncbi:hypothetical protein D9758_009235 [Tetrapyrgos nigripes]|uniref:Uncharacterized protein n=1 Tax=Tetrapyrgos nigripes TaxID=182062 RepID=A0A8H5D225_9AGAR|nr:hypothetical protein D9758_009235 [Tetrapyrgos nigripes]